MGTFGHRCCTPRVSRVDERNDVLSVNCALLRDSCGARRWIRP
jgi:hypothetical protein